jgi:hypothetical protein
MEEANSSGPALNGHHHHRHHHFLAVPKEEAKPDPDLLECIEEKVDAPR